MLKYNAKHQRVAKVVRIFAPANIVTLLTIRWMLLLGYYFLD